MEAWVCQLDSTETRRDILPALTKVMQAISPLPLRLLKKPMFAVEEADEG
jgi:hypothetical protein